MSKRGKRHQWLVLYRGWNGYLGADVYSPIVAARKAHKSYVRAGLDAIMIPAGDLLDQHLAVGPSSPHPPGPCACPQ